MDVNQLRKMISGKIRKNEPMAEHTSYGIGGPALAFIEPKSIIDLQIIKSFTENNNIPLHYIGNGSNLLVSDKGIDGFVITLEKTFKKILFDDSKCYVEAGVKLSKLVKECIKRNLSGIETLIGIPGTVGGALMMNAGAFGEEISNCLTTIELLNADGNVEIKSTNKLKFGYRTSNIQPQDLILSAEFQFEESSESNVQKKQKVADKRRKDTQPLKFRSAGSVFKNPPNYAAGYMVDNLGLKGTKIGGAAISEIHANFIVNHDNATANDVVELIRRIRDMVYQNYNIRLDLEIKTLGFKEGVLDA